MTKASSQAPAPTPNATPALAPPVGPLEGLSSATPVASSVEISPALEKALFVKFWLWISVVTAIMVPVVSGISIIAVVTIQQTVLKGLYDTATNVSNTSNSVAQMLGKIEGQAEVAKNQADKATAQADKASGSLDTLNKLVDASKATSQNIEDLKKLATDPRLVEAISAIVGPTLLNNLKDSLSNWGASSQYYSYGNASEETTMAGQFNGVNGVHAKCDKPGSYVTGIEMVADRSRGAVWGFRVVCNSPKT